MCESMHEGHTKAFFKDPYIEPNYENIQQVSQQQLSKQGTTHNSGNVFMSSAQNSVAKHSSKDAMASEEVKNASSKADIDVFQPNFEIYYANELL